jgi:hypothetical protein
MGIPRPRRVTNGRWLTPIVWWILAYTEIAVARGEPGTMSNAKSVHSESKQGTQEGIVKEGEGGVESEEHGEDGTDV